VDASVVYGRWWFQVGFSGIAGPLVARGSVVALELRFSVIARVSVVVCGSKVVRAEHVVASSLRPSVAVRGFPLFMLQPLVRTRW
jgi:hypothetical protein